MSSLTIKKLHKSYGASVDVLKGIDLEIEDGGFLVLVGPSGCGKSTLLNTIAGLESVTSGDITIDDNSIVDLPSSKRDIAMVFQSYALYPNMTVAKNISFGMEIRGIEKSKRESKIKDVAEMLQITELLKRKPGQLSGGQRQRVAMGRALVRKPKIFLFDEPLSNLDAKLRVDMRAEIKRLHQRMKTTIVYVTHDQIEALTLATKIAVLKDGHLQQAGTPNDIYNNPVNTFVAGFMGSPSMNLIDATVIDYQGGLAISIKSTSSDELILPVPKMHALEPYKHKEIIFGIRPEALTDIDSVDKYAKNIVTQDCIIDVVEPTGSDLYAHTSLAGKEIIARMKPSIDITPGEKETLAFNMDKAVFFDPNTEERI